MSINESLKEAYYLKEKYREFNLVGTYEEALIKIPEFIERFKKSKRSEMRTVGIMMENWEKEIINSFIRIIKDYQMALWNQKMEELVK